MRRHAWRALWVLALVLAPAACVVPYPQPYYMAYPAGYPAGYGAEGVSFDVFYSQLDPYGDWVQVSGLGWVWRPSVAIVGPDFRPYYTGGRWVYTSWGWQFQSIWDWGATTFHYGRWAFDSFYGWLWVPGYQWAPAWVSWRHQGGYVAWAPLPPPGFGFSGGIAWHSVPRQRFYRSWVEPYGHVHRIDESGRVTRVEPEHPVPVPPRRPEPGMQHVQPSRPPVQQPRPAEPAPENVQPSRPPGQQPRTTAPAPQHPAPPPRPVEQPAGHPIDTPHQPVPQGPPPHGGQPSTGPHTGPSPHHGH